jgi:peptide/nickel transport system substrate-binding protein
MLHKPLVAAVATFLLVASGSILGLHTGGARQDAFAQGSYAQVPYTAPQVTFTNWQFPEGFGPAGGASADLEIVAPMRDSLIQIDEKLQVIPDLATELPTLQNGGLRMAAGNLVVTWHLKPDLMWADGTPLTAAQALFFVKMNETPEGSSPPWFEQIGRMSAPDPRTLVVTYRGIYGSYLYNPPDFYNYQSEARKYGLGDVGAYATGDYDRAAWQAFVASAAYKTSSLHTLITRWQADSFTTPDDGYWNGPYKLGEYVKDQRITLVPNPYYNVMLPAMAGGKPLPRPASLVFASVSENATAYLTALRAPSVHVDMAENFQANDLPALAAMPRFTVHVQNSLLLEHLSLNQANKYLADVRVRQALALAIDKVALMHQLFPQLKDSASFVAHTFFPSFHPFANKSVVDRYDPAAAMRLLRAGGYCTATVTTGCTQVTLSIDTTPARPRPQCAEILQRDWAQIGVQLTIHPFKSPTSPGGLFASWANHGIGTHRAFDIALYAFGIPADSDMTTQFDPRYIPTATSHSANTQNASGIDDPMLTNALKQGLQSLDFATRKKWYDLAQARAADQAYVIPLYPRFNITIDNGTIVNFKPNPLRYVNTWNTWEWSKKASS